MSEPAMLKRRTFLKQASVMALALPALDLTLLGCTSQSQLARAGDDAKAPVAPWKISTVSEKEPGEPLIVSGTIYAPDGRTAAAGISLYVYQTDVTGVYSGGPRDTRIRGLMTTKTDGRYEFRTIKPAPYPGVAPPAHIHAHILGPGYPEYWIENYIFEGDPAITAEQRQRSSAAAGFNPILSLTKGSDGAWHGVRDLKLERCSRNCITS